jgi:hypothetical protein
MKPYPSFRDTERLWGITWADLSALEPRLKELLWAARAASATCRRWSDVDRVFAPIRNILTGLVGFAGRHHRHPVLGSAGAYQVAHWKLFDAVAGLLPIRAGGAEESLERQRGEIVAGTRPMEPAATAPHGLDCPANGCVPGIGLPASRRDSSGRPQEPHNRPQVPPRSTRATPLPFPMSGAATPVRPYSRGSAVSLVFCP